MVPNLCSLRLPRKIVLVSDRGREPSHLQDIILSWPHGEPVSTGISRDRCSAQGDTYCNVILITRPALCDSSRRVLEHLYTNTRHVLYRICTIFLIVRPYPINLTPFRYSHITTWLPLVKLHYTLTYTGWSKSLCAPDDCSTEKLQVMFKVFPASLQTFIDTPSCVLKDRVQCTNFLIIVSDWNCLK
jgi:hypothetical protein